MLTLSPGDAPGSQILIIQAEILMQPHRGLSWECCGKNIEVFGRFSVCICSAEDLPFSPKYQSGEGMIYNIISF